MSVTVIEPYGAAPGPAPVLALPLRLDGDHLATLPQDSAAELGQSVRLLMATRPGERLENPPYGTPDYAFAPVASVDAEQIRAVVREHEPRVTADVTVTPSAGGRVDITVAVRSTTDEEDA